MARPASLENSLALHRLNCVNRPSSFGDISVANLENMLRSSATGKFAFFLLTCQWLVRVNVQFARSTCLGDVLTTAICSDKRCSKSSLQYLSDAGPCGEQQNCHACRKKC